jgi:Flp pilus assembly protein TadD
LAGATTSTDAPANVVDPLGFYHVLDDADWQRRPAVRSLPAVQLRAVQEDVAEMLMVRALDLLSTNDGRRSDIRPRAAGRELLERIPPVFANLHTIGKLREAAVEATEDPPASVDPDKLTGEFDAYLAGVIECKQRRYLRAIEHFDDAIARRSRAGTDPRYWSFFMRAYCVEKVGQAERAIADYRVCVGLRPDFAWAHHNLGLVYANRREFEQAAGCFEQAIRLEPRLSSAYNSLGVTLFRMSKFSDAVEAFSSAIEGSGPDGDAEVFANRGAAFAAQGDLASAEADFRRALQLDPNCEPAHRNLALLRDVRE